MKFWKDLIEIPEHRSTFVLKLNEGLDNAAETVDKYVVTPALADRFDQTLGLIDKAVRTQKSQGAFLHGSFGSGKSHFMAVLNLLLRRFPDARKIDALTDVIVKHDWMTDRNFLMIPYHMLGATSMEAAIFDGYIDYVEKEHPEARLPGLFLADSILENAQNLREKMGDETFFRELNGDTGLAEASSGWGELEVGWDANSFDDAANAGPRSSTREKLVGDVVRHILPSLRDSAKTSHEQKYVPFDEGLSIISRHANELGYDGLILFLDELILWLAGKSADVKFLRQEVDKVPKLVESQFADRPIPIISFIARQRDLHEMLGGDMTGHERSGLGNSVEWWQGRFDTVELEDRNLPVIASERLLRPRDASAKELIRQSFDHFSENLKKSSHNTMLTSQHDNQDFQLVYPFSPALVQALIVLSSTLQRDRTALKLMQTLLIAQRHRLELGDVIPVGDLWDVISEGDEPMNDLMRRMMRTARNLWEHKLRPVLVRQNGIDPELPGLEVDPKVAETFRNHARLLKTLLVAALVPKLEVFEDLTVDRLIALNHGSIRTPIPGAERASAMKLLRNWASEINEISIQGTQNPIVQIRLEDVDIEPLLNQANAVDSTGNRRRKIKDLLYGWFDLTENRSLRADYQVDWCGARRTAHIIYGNVREMSVERLVSDGEHWLIVFDYPFDEQLHGPQDDINKLKQIPGSTDTIAWLPSFLDDKGRDQIGRLLKIEDVLARFDEYSTNLRQDDRPIAKTMLENSKRSVESRLELALHSAYGLSRDDSNLLDTSHAVSDHLYSCRQGFKPNLPFGKTFPDALQDIVLQSLRAMYPEAPTKIPDTVLRSKSAETIFEIIRTAIEADDRRAFVENKALRRQLQQYAEPLKLGIQGATHFVINDHWHNLIDRELQPGDEPIALGRIFALIDPEEARTGLPPVLRDLIVLSYAAGADMLISRQGREIEPTPGSLKADDLLQRRRLPSDDQWRIASELAEKIFDLKPPQILNARNVQHLSREITRSAQAFRPQGTQIADRLSHVATQHLGLAHKEITASKRYSIARQMREILLATDFEDPTSILEAITTVEIGAHDRLAIKSALQQARNNLVILNDNQLWSLLEKLNKQPNLGAAEQGLLDQARTVLKDPEHAHHLSALRELQSRIMDLLFKKPTLTEPVDPTPPSSPNRPKGTPALSAQTTKSDALGWLESQLRELPEGAQLTITVQVHTHD